MSSISPAARCGDQRLLQLEALGVADDAEAPDVESVQAQTPSGSKFSSVFFTCDMNSSATAPSISRWS